MPRQEDCRRVAHLTQPLLHHGIEHVIKHQHLPVAVDTGSNAYDRNSKLSADVPGQLGGYAFQNQQPRPRLLQLMCISNNFFGLEALFALYFIIA